MKIDLLVNFQELYNAYRNTEEYIERVEQFAIVAVNKEIIQETLKNEPLENRHLTGLIQMFKYGCSDSTFDKYLSQNIADKVRMEEISEKAYEANKWGYTGAGLNAVTNLTPTQLSKIKSFLHDAFSVNTIDDAVSLCKSFEINEIPLVKSGIYSPWLYYINPQLFPILNNSHNQFREWIEMPADYPNCIRDFNKLKDLVNEKELGMLDRFAHNFEKYKKTPTDFKLLNLNGKRFYKISHGVFRKNKDYKNTGILEVLEKNNWICMHSETGKGAGNEFEHNTSVGDYVYVCYGGDDLHCIGKVKSDAKYLDEATNDLFDGDGKWLFREIEPLYFAKVSSLREFKNDTRFFMPSGNSTFYEVPKNQLDYMSENIFIPKVNLKVIDTTVKKSTAPDTKDIEQSNITSMNSILYGPPGTGKTFHSINHAVAIVENIPVNEVANEERELVKNRFDQYVADGQVVLCTFHQSLSYEDFIEGIKPIEPETEEEQLSYAVEDGIFKRLCTEATFSFIENNNTAETQVILDITNQYKNYVAWVNVEILDGNEVKFMTKSGIEYTIIEANEKNITVKKDTNSKEIKVSLNKLSKVSKAVPDLNNLDNIQQEFRKHVGGNITVIWGILNEIRNFSATEKGTLKLEQQYTYENKKEILKSLIPADFKKNNKKKYVLIIDEINRGNVSQIFGELITLIEEDKRMGKDESLKATLPYSKDSFGVPHNLYIVGTMNTADRSVEALDTALRRRFSFIPMMPEYDGLNEECDGVNLKLLLKKINHRLTVLKDRDHTIGHAWLWNVDSIDKLQHVFKDKIIPLLQEFFYNDYEKLGLLLGDRFIESEVIVNNNLFALFENGSSLRNQYINKNVYKITEPTSWSSEAFQSIYKTQEK